MSKNLQKRAKLDKDIGAQKKNKKTTAKFEFSISCEAEQKTQPQQNLISRKETTITIIAIMACAALLLVYIALRFSR